jgi:hypothetical protein
LYSEPPCQVSFLEHNESEVFLYTPAPRALQGNYNVVNSPPPYEQIAGLITNRKRTGNVNLNNTDEFFDAASSLSHGIR